MKKRIQLVGQPNQRNLDSLQSLIEGKDQRFKGVIIVPVPNPITGQITYYVEKRPGFEQSLLGDCLGLISSTCKATAIHFSRATGKTITAFCGTDIFVDCDSVGSIEDDLVCPPILQCEFDGNSEADVSGNEATATLVEGAVVEGDTLRIRDLPTGNPRLIYANGALNDHNGDSHTIEFYIKHAAGGSNTADMDILKIQGSGTDIRLVLVRATSSGNYRKMYYRTGVLFDHYFPSTTIALDTWTHVAVTVDIPSTTLKMYYDGAIVIDEPTGATVSNLPPASGSVTIGDGIAGAQAGDVFIDDVRISPCIIYHGNSFTPPPRGSLPNPF